MKSFIYAFLIFFLSGNFETLAGTTSDQSAELKQETPVEVTYIDVRGVGRFPYEKLFEVMSEPDESLEAFAFRIGPRLRAYSDEAGFEACGVIATDGSRFSVVVGTNRGYMVCLNSSQLVMNGFRHAGATIHSHGKQGRFRPSKADMLLMGDTFAGQRASLATVHGQALDTFSDADMRSGAGYLAGTDGRMFFQGNGIFREVSMSP